MLRNALLGLILVATPVFADYCDHTAPRQAEVAASGITSISIKAEAGFLKVNGVPSLATIRARGTACASTRELLDETRLTASRNGSRLQIEATTPTSWNSGWNGKRTARLDVVVEVPSGIKVDIEDGSGEIEIQGVGALNIEDGSGALTIENTRGSVTIDDGSGDIELENITGDISIDDGSGSIDVDEITGNVSIDDSSGSIDVRKVSRDVTVEDSSGGIRVADVGGNFTLRSDSSGGVSFSDIRGRVQVPHKD